MTAKPGAKWPTPWEMVGSVLTVCFGIICCKDDYDDHVLVIAPIVDARLSIHTPV